MDDVVADRGQPSAGVRAEPYALDRRGAVAREGEQLLPREREFGGSSDDGPGGERGQGVVRVRQSLRAEGAAHMRRDHPHLLGGESEEPRHDRFDPMGTLRAVVQRQPRTAVGRRVSRLPYGDTSVRFHRAVVLHRRAVGLVDGDRGDGEGGLGIAVVGVRGVVRVDLLRPVEIGAVGAQLRVVRPLFVLDDDEGGGVPGRFRCLGDDRADQLAPERDLVGLEHRHLGIARIG